ncbi:MAG: haloalkane dehalogenase [Bacteroidetes bacterium]|nr:haloalkane dehalogenase [Bacteroidota bacterium]
MKNIIFATAMLFGWLTTTGQVQKISPEFPYPSKFRAIAAGQQLHYIDVGEGNPVLFLHGIPMSVYAWRNIIPHLSGSARCIAIDFMGFGKSDKPETGYGFSDQANYLSAFIDSLQLTSITLVMTDIGGVIGTDYAMRHPEKIKGMVFMEMPLGDAQTFHKNGGMMQHLMFWMGRKQKLGYNMIVKNNMFIKMMPRLIKRKLTKAEKAAYRQPFQARHSRVPLFVMPHAFPKKGKDAVPGDMADFLNNNAVALQKSDLPKLLLYAKPGMLVNQNALQWAEKNLSNLQSQNLGKAKHLMEEDLPHEIGEAIRVWLSEHNG